MASKIQEQDKQNNPGKNYKGQRCRGRRQGKVHIQYVQDPQKRSQTLRNRRLGIVKQLRELNILTNTQYSLTLRTDLGRHFEECSDNFHKDTVTTVHEDAPAEPVTQPQSVAGPATRFPSPPPMSPAHVETEEPQQSEPEVRRTKRRRKGRCESEEDLCRECHMKHKGNRENEVWVGCSRPGCQQWYHARCTGYMVPDSNLLKLIKFYCPDHRTFKK
ncbi:nucleosome-remodeling factor subunit BPTF-like [Mizuhopecten yessoensis]|uniref:nucleosome-remodeling factor subunit BPTF-like n=1 Tax=Mizuhopecten yessoensis TaxID=6573 RepID=UPI000B45C9B0|nr:nucleosome-remodeling factor subunit BPTF-like [Mizuhopecten yessoensis]